MLALGSASILCFCESWLNPSQPSPALLDNQTDIRCDRLTCDNKGGVLMCVPSQMKPCNVQRFATTDIEAFSVTLQFPTAHSMQVALVYRSPSVPQTTFTTVLTTLLSRVCMCHTPCLILGDFNHDILSNQNSGIVSLMSSFSFTQLVKTPTTPQGTLIDHVYYRNPSGRPDSVIVHVQDTYYSDHDTVYCKISCL